VLSITNYAPNKSINSFDTYTYDAYVNPVTDTNQDGEWDYTYDADGQLVHAIFTPNSFDPDNLTGQNLQYVYDRNGNRISETINGITTSYVVNDMNEYSSATTNGVVTNYTYDADGNLIAESSGSSTTTYTFNELSELTAESGPNISAIYGYDPLGNLISQTINGVTTENQVDPSGDGNIVAQYDISGNLLAYYVYGFGLTSQVTASKSAVYYDFNRTGSTVGLTNSSGNYVNAYAYMPFGAVTTIKATVSNSFTFVGLSGVVTQGTDLFDMRNRVYDADTGQFLSEDPIGLAGGTNDREYAANNPVNLIDPLGLCQTVTVYIWRRGAGHAAIEVGPDVGPPNYLSYGPAGSWNCPALWSSGATANYPAGGGPDVAYTFTVPDNVAEGMNNQIAQINSQPGSWDLPGFEGLGLGGSCTTTVTRVLRGGGYDIPPNVYSPTQLDWYLQTYNLQTDCPPPKPPKPRMFPKTPPGNFGPFINRPHDPNSIIGPAGFGDQDFVSIGQVLPYQVDFENEPTAGLPAQQVVITEQLDSNLDWNDFRLGSFGFGGMTFMVPVNSAFYQTTIDLSQTLGYDVQVAATIDELTGVATWTFTTIDPNTGEIPTDPTIGFLPPDNAEGAGEGFVSYTIMANPSDPDGTVINAQATVVFDTQPPLNTPQIFNTIDAGSGLTSTVAALPPDETSPEFNVSWSGTDSASGSAIASYTIYVSDDGGPYTAWLTNTTLTSASYLGQYGHTYAFYSVATDNVGNVQPTPTSAQATTMVVSVAVDATTSLQSSEDPSKLGDSVTFTATVSPAQSTNGTPTGTVQFSIDGAPVSNPVSLDANGSATLTTSSLAVGSHTVAASYINADGNFNPSNTTLAGGQIVTTADTTVAVGSSAPTSVFGQLVTFTVNVSAITAGLPTPTGTVELFDGATELGTASLNSGSATYSTAALAVGSHAITAQYLGDGNFNGNTSPVVSQTVGQAGTTTSVAASPSSSVYGQSVTFTATIGVVTPGAGTPTGSVTFMDGSTTLGTGTLNGTGTASFTTSALAVGSHAITAVYGGDGNFTTRSSNAASQIVNQASTTTTLAASPSSTTYGQSVTFTATIGVVSPGAGTPTGSVEFFDGTKPISTTPLSGSTAAVSTAALMAGTHSITAQYRGDGNFSSSTSSPATVPVSMASTTTSLRTSASTSVFGQPVTFTATIGVVAPGAGVPTGSVTFKDGSTTLGTGALNSTGQATFATTTLAVGSHTITAVYGGDPDFSGSTSAALAQTVSKDGSTAAITSSASPSFLNQSVSFTVTVSAAVPGSGTPTGTVQFSIDGSKFGSAVALAGGSATSTSISTLKLGNHTITASYSGDGNFTASTAPSFTQVVSKDNTTTSLVVTVNPSVYGQSIRFTASVAAVAPGTGTPTGTVTFSDGSTTLSTVTLTAGLATYTTTKLVTGPHAITALYNGNSTFAISTSAALTQTVNRDGTSTVVTTSANPSVYGQSVTFTATVSAAAPGSGTPTGSVTFMDGSTTLGSGTLNSSGHAVISTKTLAAGSQAITAVYGGDGNFTTSTSTALTQTVQKDATATKLTSSVNPSVFGQSVTFTATVQAASPGSGTPSGTVTFYNGSKAIGTGTLGLGNPDTATFTTVSLSVGAHAITAVYGGDGNFSTSTSPALNQRANQAGGSTTVVSSANPSSSGQAVTLKATVSAVSPGSGTPTGTVTFYDGSTTLGSATLGGTGAASFTTSSLSVGSHSIKVSYGGDADFKASTSAVLKQSVRASSSSSAAQLVDQALSALPDDDAPTVGSTVHDLALEQVSVRDRRPHRSHWRLS